MRIEWLNIRPELDWLSLCLMFEVNLELVPELGYCSDVAQYSGSTERGTSGEKVGEYFLMYSPWFLTEFLKLR